MTGGRGVFMIALREGTEEILVLRLSWLNQPTTEEK